MTARPRIGFTADNWLLYATGGLAVTDLTAKFLWGDTFNAAELEAATFSKIKAGYAIGGGVEAALGTHWTAKAEYLYVSFGKETAFGSMADQNNPGQVFTHSADLKAGIIRVGANYPVLIETEIRPRAEHAAPRWSTGDVMKKLLLGSAALLALSAASTAGAADLMPYKASPTPVLWNWSGLYIGGHVGSAVGLNNVADPLGPSIFGDNIHSPGYFGGGQIGYNWQAAASSWVFGIEADASLANLDGTNTCYAFSGSFTSLNCRAHTSAFGTMTARAGLAFGPA